MKYLLVYIIYNMKNIILPLIGTIIICSCSNKHSLNQEQKKTSNFSLIGSEKSKSFELDEDTRYNAFYLYTFSDKNNKEYLSFLNYRTNQILFYDFETCDLLFKIDMDTEGPNGVGQISGYYIENIDNIYVSSYSTPGLIKIDTAETIVRKFPYDTTSNGYRVVPSYTPSSHPYLPVVFAENKIFITQQAANHIYPADQTPVSVTIDTLTNTNEYLPFTFGDVLTDEHYGQGGEHRFSRAFNGKEFIYSFYADESIHVTSIDHQSVRKINAKSKLIDKIKMEKPPLDDNQRAKWILEVPRYGDLIYDQYRDVYYRFAYPKTKLDPNRQYIRKSLYGRREFTVIILDNQFNIIGETLFPKEKYNSYVFFVNKDGLYISSDYQINFEQSEEQLNFELFVLTPNSDTKKMI